MSRYIDADYAIEAVDMEEFTETLNMMPTADVEEVKHAKWIEKGNWWTEIKGEKSGLKYVPPFLKCTECGYENKANLIYKRCPHCGAKMDKE